MFTKVICVLSVFLLIITGALQAQNDQVIDSLKKKLHTAKDTAKVKILTALSKQYISFHTDSALYYGEAIYTSSKHVNYKQGMMEGLLRKGVAYEYKGEYQQALQLYVTALEMAKAHNDQQALHSIYTNIALVHKAWGDFLKALEYNFQALEISEQTQDSADMAFNGITFKHDHRQRRWF